MSDVTLYIPDVLKVCNMSRRLIAFEGVDASGKTTICRKLEEMYSGFRFVKIPEGYTQSAFKEYLEFHASNMANAMIYAASLADRKEAAEHSDTHSENIVMDRSLWSTVAISYVRYPEKTQDIINMFASVAEYIPVPEIIYILDVPYEVCRQRVTRRNKDTQRFDVMPPEEYERHMNLYRWLDSQNIGVRMFSPEKYNDICGTVQHIHDEITGGAI